MAEDLPPIYLNDHLAGSTVGVELVRRAQSENDGSPWATSWPASRGRSRPTGPSSNG